MSTLHARANRTRGRRKSQITTVFGWIILLLVSLAFVTWRQAQGVEMERLLRQLETERSIAESERVAASRRVEELQSRVRILRIAANRLGMRLPEDREINFLPVAAR